VSRFASTHPAEPAPTTMKSNVFNGADLYAALLSR
jgi:hypothetical protein